MACLGDRLGKSAKNSALEFPFHTICFEQAQGRFGNLESFSTTVQGRSLDKDSWDLSLRPRLTI